MSSKVKAGNFTKNAVKRFEECIISRKNYLEEVEKKKHK